MPRLLLKNATLVCPNRIIRSDLLTDGKRIGKIAPDISAPDAEVIDCHELLVLPGLIDEHVHFRDPGMPLKATIASESAAAALGGVTSFMDMPNTNPPTLSLKDLEDKKAVAARDSAVNYAFYLGAGADNLEEIKKADKNEIAGVKVYMGSTTGNLLLEDNEQLLKIFAASPTLIALHCEDTSIISKKEKAARGRYGEAIPFNLHGLIRDREACLKSTLKAVALAQETGARIHILHISTVDEIELLKQFMFGSVRTRQISGEACIPHLFFSECDYERLGGFLKCNPAVKTERDRRAVVNAVESGILTTVGTDHAPHEKAAKENPYVKCPSGCTSVQYSLLALLDLWKRGELSLETVARAAAGNVAERYCVKDRGRVEEGCYADLALVNPLKRHQVTPADIKSLCGWSPFLGHSFACSVEHTVVNGTLAVRNGQLNPECRGQALEFDR